MTESTCAASSSGASLTTLSGTWGTDQKFGLHAVDPKTFKREAKPSATWYGRVARANRLPTKIASPVSWSRSAAA